jgi:hypothetical protein
MENANNFDCVGCHTVEEDVPLNDDAAESVDQLVPGAAHFRKLTE